MDAATRALEAMVFVHDADLSADGRRVAWCAASIDGDAERLAIRVGEIGGGEFRGLGFGIRDHDAVWAPDSERLALVSEDSDGRERLLVVRPERAAVEVAVPVAQGVIGRPAWSPDGRWVSFATCTAQRRNPALPYRVTRAIPWLDGWGLVDDVAPDICVLDTQTGHWRQLTADGWLNTAPLWLADSAQIMYLASADPDAWQRSCRVRSVSLDGTVRDLARAADLVSAAPLPAGGVAATSLGLGPTGTLGRLLVIGPDGAVDDRSTPLGLDINGNVFGEFPVPFASSDPHLIVTGGGALVRVQVRDRIEIHRVTLSGPPTSDVVVDGNRCAYPLAAAAGKLLYASGTITSPPDLWLRDLGTGQEIRLTFTETANMSVLSGVSVEDFVARAPDGPDVQARFLRPAASAGPLATVLLIHGGPKAAWGQAFIGDAQLLCEAGFGILLVNPRGSRGYGAEFAGGNTGRWGQDDYADLMAAVNLAVDKGLADPDRLAVAGISYGGYMSAWIIAHTHRFKAAVIENPLTNFLSMYGTGDNGLVFVPEAMGGTPAAALDRYISCSPVTYAHQCRTPTLIIQGEQDYRTPPEQSRQLYSILKQARCEVEMLMLPGASHDGSISGPLPARRAQNDALLEWIRRHI